MRRAVPSPERHELDSELLASSSSSSFGAAKVAEVGVSPIEYRRCRFLLCAFSNFAYNGDVVCWSLDEFCLERGNSFLVVSRSQTLNEPFSMVVVRISFKDEVGR